MCGAVAVSLFPPCPPSLLRPCGFGFPTTVTHVILMILFARLETPAVTRSSHVRLFSLPLTVNHFISVLCVLVWLCFALPPPAPQQLLRARGFGFLEYKDPRDAEEALYQMDRSVFMGREISVSTLRWCLSF